MVAIAKSTTVIDTPEGITLFHMKAQLVAAKLELLGMTHSSGRSVIRHLKQCYHLAGRSKSEIVKAFAALIKEKEAAHN